MSNSFRFGDSRSMGWGFDTPSPSMQAHANPFAAATRVALSAGIGAPRVAWTPDFGLCANCVDGDVVEICRRAAERFAATAGCTLVDACPALSVDISNSACAQKKVVLPEGAFISSHQALSMQSNKPNAERDSNPKPLSSSVWDARSVFHVRRGVAMAEQAGTLLRTAIKLHNDGTLWPVILACAAGLIIVSALALAGVQISPHMSSRACVCVTALCLAFQLFLVGFVTSLKPEIRWNIQIGIEAMASEERGDLHASLAQDMILDAVKAFFNDPQTPFQLLLAPCSMVSPFDVRIRYAASVQAGKSRTRFENYIRWLDMTSIATTMCCPCVAVPCGSTADGIPVGIQIIGQPFSDEFVVAAAAVFEDAVRDLVPSAPIDPIHRHAEDPWPSSASRVGGPETIVGAEAHHAVGRSHAGNLIADASRVAVAAVARTIRGMLSGRKAC